MPRPKTRSDLLQEQENAKKDSQEIIEETVEEYGLESLGGDAEQEEIQEEAAEKAEEQRLDAETPVTRAEFERLKQQLLEAQVLVEKMSRDHGTLDSVVEASARQTEVERQNAVYRAIEASGGTVKIQIHSTDTPGGTQPVDVTINGKHWKLPRGEVVEVPWQVMAVLDNCKIKHYRPEVLPNGDHIQVPYNFYRFPYTRVNGPITQ